MARTPRRPRIILEVHPDKKEEIKEAAELHNRTLSNFCLTCIEQKLREIRNAKEKK